MCPISLPYIRKNQAISVALAQSLNHRRGPPPAENPSGKKKQRLERLQQHVCLLGLLGSARLGSARLGSARLGSARLGSALCFALLCFGSARLGSARLNSAIEENTHTQIDQQHERHV
jgi:hypothetical protein